MTEGERMPAPHWRDNVDDLEEYRKRVLQRMLIGDFDAGDVVEIYGLALERTQTPGVWNLYRPYYGIDGEERSVDLFDTWLNTINVSAIAAASELGRRLARVAYEVNAEYAPEPTGDASDDPVPDTNIKGFQ